MKGGNVVEVRPQPKKAKLGATTKKKEEKGSSL